MHILYAHVIQIKSTSLTQSGQMWATKRYNLNMFENQTTKRIVNMIYIIFKIVPPFTIFQTKTLNLKLNCHKTEIGKTKK